ncbi:MAG: hypothetical protein NVS1B7_0360 [Candidatus Saccharimonadales bacterium]
MDTPTDNTTIEPTVTTLPSTKEPVAPDQALDKISETTSFSSNKPPQKSKLGLVLLVFLLVAVCSLTGWFINAKNHNKLGFLTTDSTPDSARTPNKVASSNRQFNITKLANGNMQVAGRTWFKNPVKIDGSAITLLPPDQMVWVGCGSEDGASCNPTQGVAHPAFHFYQIGSQADGTQINIALATTMANNIVLFLTKSGQYQILENHTPGIKDATGKNIYPKLGAKTTMDSTSLFPELIPPKTLTLHGKQFTFVKNEYDSFIENSVDNVAPFAATDFGPVVLQKKAGGTDFNPERYILETYSFLKADYQPMPALDNLKPGEITFIEGNKNMRTYFSGFHGCTLGGTFYDIMGNDKQEYDITGTDIAGNKLFRLHDEQNSAIFKATLAKFNEGSFTDSGQPQAPLAMTDFIAKKPILFFKNSLGQYSALYNDTIIVGGGCGKPVIYLYPTQPTKVTVKVQADVRVSVPTYKHGWNVLALPSGELQDGTNKYDSLYWEGYSQTYPEVTNGFIVPQQALAATLRTHLGQLGLTTKESSDFMEFWLPKMPKTPYIRLTWFGTNQVNKIAPLAITPQPDTMLRIFLDYEGLEKPIQLPTQQLYAPVRHGFTVVEWGGLLNRALPATTGAPDKP